MAESLEKLRIAVQTVEWLATDVLSIDYLAPLCPECGGPLTAVIGTEKLACLACGREWTLVAKEESE